MNLVAASTSALSHRAGATKRLRTVPFLGSAFRLSGSPVTPHAFGCRDKNRTCDLQLMRLTSYQTAPRDKGII